MELTREQIPDDLMGFFEPSEGCQECYVCRMVAVFREVRRVLRDDGTLWLNLGDSYASGTGRNDTDAKNLARRSAAYGTGTGSGTGPREFKGMTHPTKPKDLVGIPWRVAFALQADGWYLRSDIIWAKPNPMPESVTDRPTKAHEYLFLLSKAPRYFYDADAVREPATNGERFHGSYAAPTPTGPQRVSSRNGRSDEDNQTAARNRRTVWTVATQPYPGAHFAVMPEALVEPCILAGTSERGVCPTCGAPWERVVERTKYEPPVVDAGVRNVDASRGDKTRKLSGAEYNKQASSTTTGWRATCDHDAEPVGAVVLDPFGGSGTVARVANRLSRRAVLIDLNPDYLAQQLERNRDMPLGLTA